MYESCCHSAYWHALILLNAMIVSYYHCKYSNHDHCLGRDSRKELCKSTSCFGKSKQIKTDASSRPSCSIKWQRLNATSTQCILNWIEPLHCSWEVFSNKTIIKKNMLYDFSLAWESWDLLLWHNKLQSNNCNIFSPSPLCKFICFDSDAIPMQDIACLVLWSVLGTEGGNVIMFIAFLDLSLNRHPSRSDAMSRHGFCQMFHTSKIPKYSNVAREKRVNGDIFGKKWEWRMFYSSILIKFSVFVQLSTQICTKSLHLFFENSCLNSATFTERVIFGVNSWQFYLSPKIFYTRTTCATCDKFHV